MSRCIDREEIKGMRKDRTTIIAKVIKAGFSDMENLKILSLRWRKACISTSRGMVFQVAYGGRLAGKFEEHSRMLML